MIIYISRFVILAIAIVALLGTTSTLNAAALQQGAMSGPHKSGDITGSKNMGTSGNQGESAAPGTNTSAIPSQDKCYVSCSTDNSRIVRTLCALGCGYVTEPAPMTP